MAEERTLAYCPFPHQREFHLNQKRFRVITGGRRSGKSEAAVQEIIIHALSTPGGLSWYIAPTYNDAYEIGFEKFLEHFDVLAPAIRSINYTNLRVTWVNNHMTYFKGAENRKSLRGRGLTLAVLDEVAFMNQDAWYQIIRPALMDMRGKAILLTTPNGRNWFHNLWMNANRDSNFEKWLWPTSINPLISDEEIESARVMMSVNDFNQEILAMFVTKAGMVYSDFNDKNIKEVPDSEIKDFEIGVGVDFGFANPSSFSLMGYNIATEQVYQFDEIYRERTDIEVFSKELEDKLRKYGIHKSKVKLFTDPAGNAAELSSGVSPVDYLRSMDYNVSNKGTEIAPGVSLVRRFIRNAKGKRSFFIHPRCVETIRSLYGYTYSVPKSNEMLVKEEPLKDGIHDHACDSVRYYFVNKFDHAKYIGKMPESSSYQATGKLAPRLKRCTVDGCRKPFISKTPRDEPPFLCPECLKKQQHA